MSAPATTSGLNGVRDSSGALDPDKLRRVVPGSAVQQILLYLGFDLFELAEFFKNSQRDRYHFGSDTVPG